MYDFSHVSGSLFLFDLASEREELSTFVPISQICFFVEKIYTKKREDY